MKNKLSILTSFSARTVGGQASSAQDWRKGWEAYNIGDYKTAFEEWRPLAEQGNARAQGMLGFMYEHGKGVPQDYVSTHMWYNIAASQGEALAAKSRDDLAEQMTPAQIAEAQRMARDCVAKNLKDCWL